MSKWDIVYENKIFNLESIDKGIIIFWIFLFSITLRRTGESFKPPLCGTTTEAYLDKMRNLCKYYFKFLKPKYYYLNAYMDICQQSGQS